MPNPDERSPNQPKEIPDWLKDTFFPKPGKEPKFPDTIYTPEKEEELT